MTRHERYNERTARTARNDQCSHRDCTLIAQTTEHYNSAAVDLTARVCERHSDKNSLREIARGGQYE